MIKKVFGTTLLLISISSHADCIKQYNKAIFELNASSASSTTAVPLLSSTAAALATMLLYPPLQLWPER